MTYTSGFFFAFFFRHCNTAECPSVSAEASRPIFAHFANVCAFEKDVRCRRPLLVTVAPLVAPPRSSAEVFREHSSLIIRTLRSTVAAVEERIHTLGARIEVLGVNGTILLQNKDNCD